MRTSRVVGRSILFLVSMSFVGNATSQTPAGGPKLVGYYGAAEMLPNADRKEVTIALTLPYKAEGGSNQIVFRVQDKTTAIPSAWSGSAQVLAGDGVLALIPKNGPAGWLFKFPERKRPSSLETLSLQEYAAFGIGRYGEKTALSKKQIQHLLDRGQL